MSDVSSTRPKGVPDLRVPLPAKTQAAVEHINDLVSKIPGPVRRAFAQKAWRWIVGRIGGTVAVGTYDKGQVQ